MVFYNGPLWASVADFAAFQDTNSGYPAPSRRTVHDFYGPGGLLVGHVSRTVMFDPAIHGGVDKLDISYDATSYDNGSSGAIAYFALLWQDGTYYAAGRTYGLVGYPWWNVNRWLHFNYTGLTATDFTRVSGPGPAFPDFSRTGSPIHLGYYTSNGTGWSELVHTESGLDNFTVSVTYTPIPDSVAPTTVATPAPMEADWYKENVTLGLAATDNAGGSGVRSLTYGASGAQNIATTTVNNGATSVTISAEGTTTLSFFATDNAGNEEVAKSVAVNIDKTAPTVQFTGTGTYTVDQTVTVTFAATDTLSGVASQSGDSVVEVPAYTLELGVHSVNAQATDKAGNVGTGSSSYTILVTYASLCALVERFVTEAGVHQSLCTKLKNAQAAEARGELTAKANILKAFINEVSAQTGKSIPQDKAAVLTRLAQAL